MARHLPINACLCLIITVGELFSASRSPDAVASVHPISGHSKFYRFSDGSIGAFAGTWSRVQEAQRFIDGLSDICPSEDWSALVVRPGGRAEFIDGDGCRLDVTRSFYAIGSGAHFALGALHCGRTAEEAVRVAEVFDQYTGGPVEVVRASEVVAVKLRRKTARKQ